MADDSAREAVLPSKGFYLDVDLNIDEDRSMKTIHPAIDVVKFITVFDEIDVLSSESIGQFKPLMAYQIFGEDENIFGYREISINLKYLHNSCKCFVDVKFRGKVSNSQEPDDFMKSLDKWLPENYVTDQTKCLELLANEDHEKIHGTVVCEFKNNRPIQRFSRHKVNAVYKIASCDVNDEEFQKFHANFETYIIWFIEGANFIDLEDKRWLIFYVYEEFVHPENNNKIYRSPVGFCSVYKFYHFPSTNRARISQFFILPTHQRSGIGSKLYQTVMESLRGHADIIDVTVEEPTEVFQSIRDYSDCICIYEQLEAKGIEIKTENRCHINAAIRNCKLCKRQQQRITDIMNCLLEHASNSTYTDTFKVIKERFLTAVERAIKGRKRLSNFRQLVPEDQDTSADSLTYYKKYVEEIEPVIKRLLARQ